MNVDVNVLSVISVEHAIDDLSRFIDKIERLEAELPKALAEYGVTIAQMRYDYAAYDVFAHSGTDPYESPMQADHPDIEVTMESDGNTATVIARGEKVLFIEFGAGVYFEKRTGGYQGVRPDDIDPIGGYGHGLGNRDVWGFTDKDTGEHHVTHGTPASNAMYFTTQDVIEQIEEVARRILNND